MSLFNRRYAGLISILDTVILPDNIKEGFLLTNRLWDPHVSMDVVSAPGTTRHNQPNHEYYTRTKYSLNQACSPTFRPARVPIANLLESHICGVITTAMQSGTE